jgi:hypothetical protein
MKRSILAVVALVLVVGLQPQAAHAGDNNNSWNAFWAWLSHGQDLRLTNVGIGLGIGADAVSWDITRKHSTPAVRTMTPLTAYGATAAGCVVVYPFVATVVHNRPLTPREAYTGMADCIVPFVGGWLVNARLPPDAWTDGKPMKRVPHRT